tara:strand:- start:393 stop:938 length:546 start_codon:yes stop_codon:yes gene_type:complete
MNISEKKAMFRKAMIPHFKISMRDQSVRWVGEMEMWKQFGNDEDYWMISGMSNRMISEYNEWFIWKNNNTVNGNDSMFIGMMKNIDGKEWTSETIHKVADICEVENKKRWQKRKQERMIIDKSKEFRQDEIKKWRNNNSADPNPEFIKKQISYRIEEWIKTADFITVEPEPFCDIKNSERY